MKRCANAPARLALGGLLALACLAAAPAQSQRAAAPASPPPAEAPRAAAPAAPDEDRVFAPFVNRLRIAVRDPQVRLTWVDIPDFKGSYLIYRHNQEINLGNIAKASLVAEVDPGEEFFTDVPPATGTYFYAILAKDPKGLSYKVFIPFRNITMAAVAVNATPQAKDQTSEISNFGARLWGSAIQVSLASSHNLRTVAIFRSTQPLRSAEDLRQASQVWVGNGRQIVYADYAVPGVPYYYAAVDAESLQQGAASVEQGRNSLAAPIEIPLGKPSSVLAGLDTPRTVRIMPLPVLTLPELNDSVAVLDGTNPARVSAPLEPRLKAACDKLASGLRPSAGQRLRPAEILPSDRLQAEGKLSGRTRGEGKALADILAANFSVKNWDESKRQLGNLLTLPLSRELAAKAHFYLAQTFYQTRSYREALLEFLYVQDELPEYAQSWIENTLAISSQW